MDEGHLMAFSVLMLGATSHFWSTQGELAALQGLAYAQTNLGRNYAIGRGVLQNNVLAHMWFNIGSANGSENGGSNRDKISKKMTSADISKAQAMARECMSSGYTKCGY